MFISILYICICNYTNIYLYSHTYIYISSNIPRMKRPFHQATQMFKNFPTIYTKQETTVTLWEKCHINSQVFRLSSVESGSLLYLVLFGENSSTSNFARWFTHMDPRNICHFQVGILWKPARFEARCISGFTPVKGKTFCNEHSSHGCFFSRQKQDMRLENEGPLGACQK